jgi:hypothetical protein
MRCPRWKLPPIGAEDEAREKNIPRAIAEVIDVNDRGRRKGIAERLVIASPKEKSR